MSATDELRNLLDERGVEYVLDEDFAEKYPPEQRVTWSCDMAGEPMTITARDYCIGTDPDEYCLDLEFHEVFTPEQAVEATLGRGDYTYEQWREISNAIGDAMEYAHDRAIEHPDVADPLWNLDEYVERVMQAAFGDGAKLGRGKCHIDGGECDQCGAWVRSDAVTYWMPTGKGMQTEETHALHFCPNCGARVMSE